MYFCFFTPLDWSLIVSTWERRMLTLGDEQREELSARRNTYTHTPPAYAHGGGYPQPQDRRPTPRGYDERDPR